MISTQKDHIIAVYILLVSFVLVALVYLIFYIIFYKRRKDMERIRCYECGFDIRSFTRITFSYRFFLISILFIIFDVEISLILPVPFLIERELSLLIFILFLLVLIVGLLYEYKCGALEWLNIVIKA